MFVILFLTIISSCLVVDAFPSLLPPDCSECSGNSTDNGQCSGLVHDCDPNALCTDTIGSFACTCKKGFTGKGQSCQGKPWKKPHGKFHVLFSVHAHIWWSRQQKVTRSLTTCRTVHDSGVDPWGGQRAEAPSFGFQKKREKRKKTVAVRRWDARWFCEWGK